MSQTSNPVELHLHPDRRPLSPRAIAVVAVILAFSVTVLVLALFALIAPKSFLSSPLSISVCAPADFDYDLNDCRAGAPLVDPPDNEPIKLSEASFPVAGKVTLDSSTQVAYHVKVEWIPISGGVRYATGIDTTVSYTNAEQPYGAGVNDRGFFAWTPPAAMVEAFADRPVGSSLGKWRIIGTATPVRPDMFAPYVWDSVRTFQLEAG